MDYKEKLYFKPSFDFSDFYKERLLCDCKVVIHSENDDTTQEIDAHVIILANSSQFFYNAFTAEMEESKTGVVHVYMNPGNLVPRVISWLYDGKLQFTVNEIIPLLQISQYYGIDALMKDVTEKMQNIMNKEVLSILVNQCYEMQLENILDLLVPTFVQYYSQFSIEAISELVDCSFFAKVIKKMKFTNEEALKAIQQYIGQSEITETDDREALASVLDKSQPGLKALIRQYNAKWVPDSVLLTAL